MEFTSNKNLYKWKTTDTKRNTITEMANNAQKIDVAFGVIEEKVNGLPERVGALETGKADQAEVDTLSSSVAQKPTFYDAVNAMVNDSKLKAGDTAITNGYYSAKDGGAARYKIESTGGSLPISLSNGLYANLIYNDEVCAAQYGFTPANPDVAKLNKILTVANCKLIYGDYPATTPILMKTRRTLDLNYSVIYSQVIFDGVLQATLKNGFIHADVCISYEGGRNGNTNVTNVQLYGTSKGIQFKSDTGYNIHKSVGIHAPIGVDIISGGTFSPNYIYFDKCGIEDDAALNSVGFRFQVKSNYIWITNCDILTRTGISIDENSENFVIRDNVFFDNEIGVYIPAGKRLWNGRILDNLFSDQSNMGSIPIKIDGSIKFSKIDNQFYNMTKGYTIANADNTTLGRTLDSIKGHLISTVTQINSAKDYSYSTSQAYAVAGTYTLGLVVDGRVGNLNPIVNAPNGSTINSITITDTRVQVNITLTTAGTVYLIAV